MRSVVIIDAVTVNHNTSSFVELMLRTLFLCNNLRGIHFRMTVLDNASDDIHADSLQTYLASEDIPLVQTGFDNQLAPEKHGQALAEFVKSHDDCSHYLFLDSDMWFVEMDTLAVMLRELTQSPPSIFANQAQIYGYYAHQIIEGLPNTFGSGDLEDIETWRITSDGTHAIAPRCSPVCCLVRNTPVFRKTIDLFGLDRATRYGVKRAIFYDTFALMTHVMATHGEGFIISSKRVNHFTETANRPEFRAIKDRDCMKMLHELRLGHGMELDLFRKSDWDAQST